MHRAKKAYYAERIILGYLLGLMFLALGFGSTIAYIAIKHFVNSERDQITEMLQALAELATDPGFILRAFLTTLFVGAVGYLAINPTNKHRRSLGQCTHCSCDRSGLPDLAASGPECGHTPSEPQGVKIP